MQIDRSASFAFFYLLKTVHKSGSKNLLVLFAFNLNTK